MELIYAHSGSPRHPFKSAGRAFLVSPTSITMSVKNKYVYYLTEYPLLTKCATAGMFAALNEAIASAVARDYQTTEISVLGKKHRVRHVLSPKILLMVLYGALISTPIAHALYLVLNRVFKGNLSGAMKLMQMATSLLTISPALSAAYVAFLSLINGYKCESQGVAGELRRMTQTVRFGLKKSFWAVYRTSAQTSVVLIAVAQKFIAPQLWIPFFSVVYFVIGTIQNSRFKLKQKEMATQTGDDEKDAQNANNEKPADEAVAEPAPEAKSE